MDVIIADDDIDNAMFIVRMLGLRFRSLSVIAARTGEDALQLAERDPPSLLLAALRMPDINGLEIARRLKIRIGSSVKVVIMTRENTNWIPPEKVDGVLLKPFSIDAMCRLVKVLLKCDAFRDENPMNTIEG